MMNREEEEYEREEIVVSSYEDAIKLIGQENVEVSRFNPENVIVWDVFPGDACNDGGEYGEGIIFSPSGWWHHSTIDGFWCRRYGGREHFLRSPCETCQEFNSCVESDFENQYPVRIWIKK